MIISLSIFIQGSCLYSGNTLITDTTSWQPSAWQSSFASLLTTIITKNGTVGYLAAVYDTGGIYVTEYNLTTGIPTYITTFDNTGMALDIERMELTNQYLFLYSSLNKAVHYYNLTSRKREGTFHLGESTR
jgi:hypothetical protein